MENSITLSFEYKDKLYNLDSVFVRAGFTHQFHIQLDGNILIIEFDEERNYRVIDADTTKTSNIEIDLLQAMVNKISSLH